MKNIIANLLSIGAVSTDSEELKLKKSSLILVPLIIGPAAFIWGLIYIYLDHYISASIPLSYALISIFNLWQLEKTKNILFLQNMQMILVLFLPFFLMWSLGRFSLGSFVFIWAFYAPVASLTYEENKNSLYWFYSFIALVILSVLLDQTLQESHISCMPEEAIALFYFLNVSAGLSGIYFLLRYFISEKEKNAHKLLKVEHEALQVTTEELKEVNEKLNHLANYDSLTDLPNRYLLRENLERMISIAKRQEHILALLFLDLDGFKKINDDYGHAVGDEVLLSVAKRLKPLLREEDIIARIGGDEFVIALGNIVDKQLIKQISQRILEEINRDYDCIPGNDSVGVSIGISFFPDDAQNIDSLINSADTAMYWVKASGKNGYKVY